jgi:D-amino-acid dehydrogenase
MTQFDAIVVGGGIVGSAAADHLTLNGAKTLLIDRADPGRATDAGAGIIDDAHAGPKSDDPFSAFMRAAFDHYPPLIERLHSTQSQDTGFAACGEIIVAVDAEEAPHLNAMKMQLLGHDDRVFEITPDAAKVHFPPLAAVHGAMHYRHAARVDGRKLNAALQASAQKNGLTIKNADVRQLKKENGRVVGVLADGETLLAAHVIIAGGAWSGAFGEPLGIDLPIGPMRGQIIHLHMPNADTGAWPIVSAFHHHYIVCWPGGRVVVGATRERKSDFATQPTVAGMLEVFSEALRVAPGLLSAQFHEMRVGLRPVAADGVPIIGSVPDVPGIFIATGHGAVGLQLGPFSGKVAAEWALGNASLVDLTPFSVNRFRGKPDS